MTYSDWLQIMSDVWCETKGHCLYGTIRLGQVCTLMIWEARQMSTRQPVNMRDQPDSLWTWGINETACEHEGSTRCSVDTETCQWSKQSTQNWLEWPWHFTLILLILT